MGHSTVPNRQAAMIFPGRFGGKVAVVTGAAQGIGRTVALRLAHEDGCQRRREIASAGRSKNTSPTEGRATPP